MSATTVGAGLTAKSPALRVDRVGKVFCDRLFLARKYAIRDILGPRRDRLARLRPGEWVALRDISFEVRAGETLLVLGGPDSGKTTLTSIITGQRAPDSGTVFRAGTIGILGRGKYGQTPLMKVREYVRLMAVLQGVQAEDLTTTCDEILDWTDLRAHRNTMVYDLPKPLIAPLSLVGSLLVRHDIYVFDDYAPLGDTELERRLAVRLDEILATCACVVTSDGSEVPGRVNEVAILHGGEIIHRGEPDEALHVYERFSRHARRLHERRGPRRESHQRVLPPLPEAKSLIADIVGGAEAAGSGVDLEIAHLWDLKRPIVLGPCLSDLSWEVLFWLPFVKWARRHMGVPAPAVALSRGALGPWYADAAQTFVDVYDLIPVAEFHVRDEERTRDTGSLKQTQMSRFERELVQLAATRCNLSNPEALHPSVLLGLLAQVWRGRIGLAELTSRAIYERLPPLVEHLPALPPNYVAMCFRFTSQFPDNPESRAVVADTIRTASARMPVVVLSGLGWTSVDQPNGGCGVQLIDPAADPRRIHQIQAGVIGGARAAIGTLNGPVMLGPFLGVPTMCLHAPSGGFLEFQTGTLRHAAEQLRTPVTTAALGTITTGGVSRWLDEVLDQRPSVHAGADRA